MSRVTVDSLSGWVFITLLPVVLKKAHVSILSVMTIGLVRALKQATALKRLLGVTKKPLLRKLQLKIPAFYG